MASPPALELGRTYHIYNRGTNGASLFVTRRNYRFFLGRYATYIEPVAETYAYCLMGNHFHVAVRTREVEEQADYHAARADGAPFKVLSPSRQFSNLFNAYARAYNHDTGRTGSLFEHPFHRKVVEDEGYFWRLIAYIHRNPQHHGFVDDFRAWPYSSYGTFLTDKPTRLPRDVVLQALGGPAAFAAAHAHDDYGDMADLLLEENL